MDKLIFGKGVNDVEGKTQLQKDKKVIWRCPFYDRWTNMLRRCYSKSYQKSFPTYVGCTVCEEWLRFSTFKTWMQFQDWEGKELDKDLLSGKSKIYSPETCGFIGKDLNNFIIQRSTRNELPLGGFLNRKTNTRKFLDTDLGFTMLPFMGS